MSIDPRYSSYLQAQRVNRIAAARAREELRKQYREYAAEQRACGYEVESFEQWNGEISARELAEERMGSIRFSDLDLY